MTTECRHIHWEVKDDDTFGIVTCSDCGTKLKMSLALNQTMEYVKSLIQELEALVSIETIITTKKPGRPKKDG
jgi:hypothetical protein